MSVHVSSWVWKHAPRMDPTAMLVLVSLADQAHDDGVTWASASTIGQRCRISERQARTWIHRLATDGLIRITERPGRTSLITVLCDEAASPEPVEKPTEPRKPTAGLRAPAGVKPTAGHPGSPPQGTPEAHRRRTVMNRNEPQQQAAARPTSSTPEPLRDLERRCREANLTARFDRLSAKDAATICDLLRIHGPLALVRSAKAQHRADNPAQHAKAWIGGWQALPTPIDSARSKCPEHPHQTQPCPTCASEVAAGLRREPA